MSDVSSSELQCQVRSTYSFHSDEGVVFKLFCPENFVLKIIRYLCWRYPWFENFFRSIKFVAILISWLFVKYNRFNPIICCYKVVRDSYFFRRFEKLKTSSNIGNSRTSSWNALTVEGMNIDNLTTVVIRYNQLFTVYSGIRGRGSCPANADHRDHDRFRENVIQVVVKRSWRYPHPSYSEFQLEQPIM